MSVFVYRGSQLSCGGAAGAKFTIMMRMINSGSGISHYELSGARDPR